MSASQLLRSTVLAFTLTAVALPAWAQSGPVGPAMPPNATAAQEGTTLSSLDGLITGYKPTPPPAGQKSLGGKIDANATSLLNQMKAKGIGVRMINLFISSGGSLTLTDGAKLNVGGAGAVAKYNPETSTITVTSSLTDNSHNLKPNLANGSLADIAHEFWHAYKAQIVDGGFDPDTAKVFADLKNWLGQQTKVTLIENEKPGATMTFAKANPGWFKNGYVDTQASYTDDFADEYVAAIITQLMARGPYPRNANSTTQTYAFLGGLLNGWQVGYFNENAKNYRIDAPPPPDLILHLERLIIGQLLPSAPAAAPGTAANGAGGTSGTGTSNTGPGSGKVVEQAPAPKADVAPEHSSRPTDDPAYEFATMPRSYEQPQQPSINCFGDAACERALAQTRSQPPVNCFGDAACERALTQGRANYGFDNGRDPKGDDRRPTDFRGAPTVPDFCYAGACAPVPGPATTPSGGYRR